MKKKIFSLGLALLMILQTVPAAAFAASETESPPGSPQQEGTYYVLNTEEDLNWFAKEVNTGNTSINAKLGKNIEVSQTHTPIGTKAKPFSGIFDGNRKSITLHSGVTFIDTNERYGLFGTLQGTVKNLTVKGTVDLGTKVGNVGGIAGYADAGSTIEHCINEAAVSGKNNVGGISGYNNATIINCGNEGNVSTTGATNAGGIAGGTFSKAQLISGCYNRGNISAKTSIAGGITGACMADITLQDCYSTGEISASSSDRNGYTGGIIGQISYNKKVELQRIYAAGTISGKTTDAICGKSMGKPTASDVFFLDTLKSSVPDVTALSSEQLKAKFSDLGEAFAADTAGMNGGYPVLAWQNGGDTGLSDLKGTISVSGEVCCYSTLTASYHSVPGEENLNLSYQWCRNGVPVENAAEAQYKVTEEDLASDLSVSVSVDGYNRLTSDTMHVPDLVAVSTEPAEAQITISKGDKVYQNITGQPGIYSLPAGAYSYTVTMGEGSEYVDEKGTFQVPGKELLEVVLKEKLYETDFAVKPDEAENAEITVKDSQGRLYMPEKGSGKYQLKKGTYSLTAELFGFETVHKNFDVTAAGIVEIQMKKLPAYDIVFKTKNFSQEQSKKLHLTVKTGGKTVYTGNRMSLSLPEGDYQYTVSCGGYRSEIGTFKVEKKNTLVEFSMTRDTGWDGRTMTEPSRDAGGVYLICNAAELMWFNRHAKMDDSAKLMADITVNQDMRLDENQLHVWNPIGNYVGYSGSRPYEGNFDGDGHSITGLYIPGSDVKNAAFCGYLGEGGVIRNLTIDGVVKNERSRNQYVAGIASTCKGLIAGCVNLAEISGGSYVGGIVGSADKMCRIENSVNQGSVTASAERAGGICGVLYAEGSQAVSGCCNFGKVQAKGFAGGITGDFYSGAGIVNTYNRGEVISQGVSGGIAGNFRSGTMNHVYHAGTVKGAQNGTGSIAGRLEWAGGSRTFDQVFWLEGSAESEIGNTGGYSISGQAQKMSEEELKSVDLGNAYTEDRPPYINDGYPVLKWQAGEVFEPEKPESRPDAWDGKETSQPQQKDGIYQIGNAAELKWFADQINSGKIELKAVLTADIDLNHQEFSSIGGSAENHAFRGTFDGAYKKIKGFYQDASESGYGLFAVNAGTVKNFTISGKADARDVYGVVAGKNSGVIEGCTNEVSVNGGNQIGGIVGVNLKNGEVRRCRNKADIEGARMVGGIAGRNHTDALIEECANSGTVLSVKEFCGGICAENEGNLLSCYNKGLIVCMSDILRAYAGGVAGHNAGYTSDIYNTGNVVSAGGYAGGVLGISTVGSLGSATAENLYGIGEVCGAFFEGENAEEQYFVGGATGNRTDAVQNAYYLSDLKAAGGGIAKSSAEMKKKGFALTLGTAFKADTENLNYGYPMLKWQTAANTLKSKPALGGTVEISGTSKAGEILSAEYKGDEKNLIYVWYTADDYGEYVLSVSRKNTFKIPVDLVGHKIRVKVFSKDADRFAEASASSTVEGMNGSISISGIAVVGKVVKAAYSRTEDEPEYQWYRGTVKIPGADSGTYTVTEADKGYVLKVRVTGNKAGFVEKAMKDKVVTAEHAGVWSDTEVSEPALVAGVYVIETEAELKWFASQINGGKTGLNAKLADHIQISGDKWYPIGSEAHPFAGTFDGNGKEITFALKTDGKAYQGLFGYIEGKGTVKKLTVNGTLVLSGETTTAGIVAGYSEGKILNCISKGSVQATEGTQIGGITGSIGLHGRVERCRNEASVSAKERAGGIAGVNSYGDTYYCSNKGLVSVSGNEAGGIVGSTQNYAVITGCYNTAEVKGSMYVGGISGKVYVAAAPQACYSTGKLTGTAYTAGAVGDLGGTDYITIVTGSFYDKTLPKDKTAKGVSLSDMKGGNFASVLNREAFEEIYTEDEKNQNRGLPVLKWEAGIAEEKPEKPGPEEEKDRITVSFTLVGDTKHGTAPHEDGNHTWIARTTLEGLPRGTTAYDVFKRVLGENGYSFTARANSYVADITTPAGLKLGELDNGPYSGWMYTINSVFPDYMESVKLKDGDDIRVFFTDDYRYTGWDSNGKPGDSIYNPTDPEQKPVWQDITASVSGKEASAKVPAADIDQLISDALKNKADIIDLNIKGADKADKISVELPKVSVKNIADKTDAALHINTALGNVTLDRSAMTEAVKAAAGDEITLILEKKAASDAQKVQLGDDVAFTDVKLLSGGKEITDLGTAKITVELPVSDTLAAKTCALAIMDADGKLTKLSGKVVTKDDKKYFRFETSVFGSFVLAEEAKLDAAIKEQNEQPDYSKVIAGVKATTIKAKSELNKHSVKLTWTKSKGYKVDGYQVYRSTKKDGKFKKIGETKKRTYLNSTNLRKGIRYYYKVRGVRRIDGKNYYTKWSNLANRKMKAASLDYSVKKVSVKAEAAAVKGAVKVSFRKSGTVKVDGYQVYRADKKNGAYKKIATTKKTTVKNTKNLKKGKTYYYKVRGYRTLEGKKIYTKWSSKVSAKVK